MTHPRSSSVTEEVIAELQYEAGMYKSLYEHIVSAIAKKPLSPCTQAELDAWEKHLDHKDAQLLVMWVDRALKAEAALAGVAQPPTIPIAREAAEPTQYLIDQFREHGSKPSAQAVPEPNTVIVPRTALEWLFGAMPDHEGMWFGESIEQKKPYGWRSRFRTMCEALGYPIPSTSRGTVA